MTRHRVTIIGRFCPVKVLKKLRKKTRKRVEIIELEEEDDDDKREGLEYNESTLDDDGSNQMTPLNKIFTLGYGKYEYESSIFTILSDENPNACLIM